MCDDDIKIAFAISEGSSFIDWDVDVLSEASISFFPPSSLCATFCLLAIVAECDLLVEYMSACKVICKYNGMDVQTWYNACLAFDVHKC